MVVGRSTTAPRSVADATRFTSSTPHAHTKSSSPASPSKSPSSASAAAPRSRQQPTAASHQPLPRRGGPGAVPPPRTSPQQSQQHAGETIEERVRRLRAAHLAAKQHDVSRFDRIVNASRRYVDAAHKFSVMSLIGFSGLALFVTIYATADMAIYNRKRRSEFLAVQKKLKEDSLEAARLAYMTGNATEDQIAMVEEATARARETGVALPSLLSAPRPAAPAGGWGEEGAPHHPQHPQQHQAPRSVFPGEAMVESNLEAAEGEPEKKKGGGGFTGWLFGGLKKEESPAGGEESSSSASSFDFGREESAARAGADTFRDKAKAAFEQERENQKRGGPLDQVGLDAGAATQGEKKKGWLW